MRQRHGKSALHIAGLLGQVFEIAVGDGAVAAFEGLRRAQLGVIEGLFVAAAEGSKKVSNLAGIYSRDGVHQRGESVRSEIALLASAVAIRSGHHIVIGPVGIGYRNRAVAAIAEADLTGGAVEHIDLVRGPSSKEVFHLSPVFKTRA